MPMVLAMGIFLFLMFGVWALQTGKAEAALADHVVINEVQTVGIGNNSYDDWVELYNPTATAVDLSTWSIQKSSSAGTTFYKTALSGVIPAQGYFLIVRDNAATTQSLKDLKDVLASDSNFSLADHNIICLVNDNVTITNVSDINVVDYVGMGTATYFEGSASAFNPTAGKSIVRTPDGEDSNNNNLDFLLSDTPTPKSGVEAGSDSDLGGTVLLTITPDAESVQNISPTGAQVVFQVNGAGAALVNYGFDSSYGSSTLAETVTANTTKNISLTNLTCATTYHYSIHAENVGATESDDSVDATFTTLPCGIALDDLTMPKSSAKANNQFGSGWEWEFNITIWNMSETTLKMKFDQWSGAGTLSSAGNMRYSVDNGANWKDITANNEYPTEGLDISAIDNGAEAGRQIKIMVTMKVPVGTAAGYYNSNYGILTE